MADWRLVAHIEPGEQIRWWLGFAWTNWNRRDSTYMLVPFNWIAGGVRRLWHRIQRGPGPSKIDSMFGDLLRAERRAAIELIAAEQHDWQETFQVMQSEIASLRGQLHAAREEAGGGGADG